VSYDLYVRGKIDRDKVRTHFEERGYRVSEKQAFFENKATGVYWSFMFDEDESPLAFNLNYFRPHVFGLEAEPELTELIEEFEFAIHDPQGEMGEEAYSAEGFLRGWNDGNQIAHRAMAKADGAERPFAVPGARNAAVWRWNYVKEETLDHVVQLAGEIPQCFAPTVMMMVPKGDRAVKTCVFWDLDMAVMIPEVDLVASIVDRTLVAAPRADVVALLDRHSQWRADRPIGAGQWPLGMAADLFEDTAPATKSRLEKLMRPIEMARIPTDHVLDEELVAEAFG